MPTLTIPEIRGRVGPLLAACLLPAAGLFAGPADTAPDTSKNQVAAQTMLDTTPLDVLDVEGSYVGASGFTTKEFNGAGAGFNRDYTDQAEIESSVQYGHRFHLAGKVYLKLGVDYNRFDFDETTAPIPSTLQNLSGLFAVEYVVDGQPVAFIRTRPGVYLSNFDHVKLGSVDAPTDIGSLIPVRKNVYLLAGAHFAALEKFPVLPFGGLVWLVNDRIRLMAIPPDPRLIVSLGDHVEIFAGAEILGDSYKSSNIPGVRPQFARFSNGVVDYSEYRGGAGITLKPCKAVGIDIGGGWSFERDFDYYRGNAAKEFETRGAPYGRLAISAQF